MHAMSGESERGGASGSPADARRMSMGFLVFILVGSVASAGQAKDASGDAAWVESMKQVHARFKGQKGTFAHFGDSITISMAFWAPLQYRKKNMPLEMKTAFELVKSHMKPECWRGWKGPKFGNQGRMTIRWAHQNVDAWLRTLDPEVALIMFGTNDLNQVKIEEYERKTREVVRKCLDNGTIVILSTIPPRSRMLEKSRAFAEVAKKIGAEMRVPVCDFFGECLKRRPDDWDGKMEKFRDRKGYDVLTLIAGDGVHPSNPKEFRNDFSEEALRTNGFSLRNHLALMSYAEVIRKVLSPVAPKGD